ncbi:polyenoic fatty acid isomerase-like [Mizuhopecten yessoensis]|uniref:Polyenoic fatty acid isomerase n=1 Tax=Mizuhopecten yessoensis TaxID=6573 RepID=A0A210QDB8_MIZYE|nr:polyenoic fatty acid isomerase-like [Mizuhopecten yessoensis]OWF46743.1 Polyenoic fatty acid isomerase [Mizuhopecten yessoensis]
MVGKWKVALLILTLIQDGRGQTTPQGTDPLLVHVLQVEKHPSKIPGPKSLKDKIAIVGAGPSGIHMAYKLKKAGFKNVVVLEKSGDVGGKSRTIYHRGVPHEMGTCYTHPDYEEIYELIREHDAGDILPMPSPSMWVDTPRGKVPLTSSQYYAIEARKIKPDMANGTEGLFFQAAIQKYIKLHTSLFGQYEGMLMPRPDRAKLAATNMTFVEFLRKHDIEILKAIFLPAATMQGYGHVDEVSDVYAMMWLTPNFLTNLLRRDENGESNIKILSKGFQFLWQEMRRQNNLDVRLNSPVLGIVRSKRGFILIYRDCNFWRFEHFDFLILTPFMKSLSNVIQFNREENSLFQTSFHYYFMATLADTTYGRRSETPTGYFANNIKSKIDNLVWGFRDSYASLNNIIGANYSSGIFPGGTDGKKLQSSIYYQMLQARPVRAIAEQMLRDHVNRVEQAQVVGVQKQIVWDYFARYPVPDIANGILWDILDIQGKYGIWYIGSSVSFESLTAVVGYNNLLLKRMDLPKM